MVKALTHLVFPLISCCTTNLCCSAPGCWRRWGQEPHQHPPGGRAGPANRWSLPTASLKTALNFHHTKSLSLISTSMTWVPHSCLLRTCKSLSCIRTPPAFKLSPSSRYSIILPRCPSSRQSHAPVPVLMAPIMPAWGQAGSQPWSPAVTHSHQLPLLQGQARCRTAVSPDLQHRALTCSKQRRVLDLLLPTKQC